MEVLAPIIPVKEKAESTIDAKEQNGAELSESVKEEVEVYVSIPQSSVGFVKGRQGSNIRYGVKLIFCFIFIYLALFCLRMIMTKSSTNIKIVQKEKFQEASIRQVFLN